MKAKVETFKRNFYDFCQNCAWVQVDYLGRKVSDILILGNFAPVLVFI